MKKKKRLKNNIRYSKLVIFVSLLLFCVMIGRVIQLGTSKKIDGIELKKLASQRTTKTDIISANRGTIYSSNGDTLAQNVASYKLIAYLDSKRTTNKKRPQHVVDKEDTAEKLAPILEMEKDEVLYYLNKEGVYQTEFGAKGKALNELTKTKIDNLNLPGIDFIENYKRYYPKGNFASYVVGYAKTENDENSTIKGEMGIEKQYDSILKGEDGSITYQKDLKGYKIANTPVVKKDAIQGKDIYLTIDSNIQFFIEQAINECHEEARFNITDVKYTGIAYTEERIPPKKAIINNKVNWTGLYNEVYVANYDGEYTDNVAKFDEDSLIAAGKFYNLYKVYPYLKPEHQKAIEIYYPNKFNSIYKNNFSSIKHIIPDKDFGIPSQRRFPVYDVYHTIKSIENFNSVDFFHEKELAYNIIKRIKLYNIDLSRVDIKDNNRIKKYL